MSATGCFLQPMPSDPDPAPNANLSPDPVADEPPIENPIRPPGVVVEDPPAATPDAPVEQFGDLNDDGIIDDGDVDLFRDQFGNLSDEELAAAADFDGDGAVTLVDFQIFLSLLTPQE